MTDMKVRRVIVGPLGTNCYLVWDPKTLEGVIIDPGAQASIILNEIKNAGIEVSGILLTHTHYDHTGACERIQKETKSPIYLGEKDLTLLKDPAWMKPLFESSDCPSFDDLKDKIRILKEGDCVGFGNLSLKAIETPGHTPGSLSYYGEGHLFSGDVIFRGGIGRTDLPGGNEEALFQSITRKILTLSSDTMIHPGHDGPTTVKREGEENPYLAF